MRLSSLMCSVALAGAALAGSAQAGTFTVKVAGSYIAGNGATLPDTGPVSGTLIFEETPQIIGGQYWVYDILAGSYLRFGEGSNFYDFVSDQAPVVLSLKQSVSLNVIDIGVGNDKLGLNFAPPSSDFTTPYAFFNTPVSIQYSINYDYNHLYEDALGGRTHVPDFRNPSISLTLTSVADAVPEPATWALMIGGFGLAGAALRRRPMKAAAT